MDHKLILELSLSKIATATVGPGETVPHDVLHGVPHGDVAQQI